MTYSDMSFEELEYLMKGIREDMPEEVMFELKDECLEGVN